MREVQLLNAVVEVGGAFDENRGGPQFQRELPDDPGAGGAVVAHGDEDRAAGEVQDTLGKGRLRTGSRNRDTLSAGHSQIC